MKKALVIEDGIKYRKDAQELSGGRFVVPSTLSEVERELRETNYAAILIDRNLEGFTDNNRPVHGDDIVEALRSGEYGPINKDTPLFNYGTVSIPSVRQDSNVFKTEPKTMVKQDIESFIQTYLQGDSQ